jgi:hypothetical protein
MKAGTSYPGFLSGLLIPGIAWRMGGNSGFEASISLLNEYMLAARR